jgi:F-type H+-transporting ATPase subunit epsilon
MEILSADAAASIEDVVSFIGTDASGSFGILARRERFVTMLSWGACRFQTSGGRRSYVATPGGALSFDAGLLRIATTRFFLGDDYASLLQRLAERMRAEADDTKAVRQVLRELDSELLRRLAAPEGRA